MGAEPPFIHSARAKTSVLAIWSLVLGCLGVLLAVACIGPLFAIPAVICGHLARARIKRSPAKLSGGGIAAAGLLMGYCGFLAGLVVIPFVVSKGVPQLTKTRPTDPASLCIDNLRLIDAAKQSCALEKKLTSEETPTAADLKPFLGREFPDLRCPAGGLYSINPVAEPPTCTVPAHRLTEGRRKD